MQPKIPLAWLQLTREKIRLLVALAGISFACILMFMQLGFQDALFESAVIFHKALQGDIFLVSPQSNALIAMANFSERRLYQALNYEGVERVSPIYLSFALWKNPENRRTRSMFVIGFNPMDPVITLPELDETDLTAIKKADILLFDRASRQEFGATIPQDFEAGKVITTELGNRRVTIGGLFQMGATFGADGNVLTSDLNFLRIFGGRKKGTIDVGLIQLEAGVDPARVLEKMRGPSPIQPQSWIEQQLEKITGQSRTKPKLFHCKDQQKIPRPEGGFPGDVCILSKEEFVDLERSYWAESTAIGFIFTLGTVMGFIVGIVIVYQILYTDVSDHLAEYATLKAMGYTDLYLLNVVFQEAIFLSVLGYIPGFILTVFLYDLTQNATQLPIGMTIARSTLVFSLAVAMCMISGAIAVRKLRAADPADIF
jgi:putative ABC transport system permease protein